MFSRTVICINGNSPGQMIDLINRVEEETEVPILEIRADYLQKRDLTNQTVKTLRTSTKRKMILTLRKRDEGGLIDLNDQEREDIFQKAINAGFDYVDVELSSSNDLISTILKNRGSTSIILSYHNFDRTDQKDIEEKYKTMKELNPDIIKIVTMAQSSEDNKIVENLIIKNRMTKPLLTCFCMGSKGRKSRIEGHRIGNVLTYLALDDKAHTGPGQITYREWIEL